MKDNGDIFKKKLKKYIYDAKKEFNLSAATIIGILEDINRRVYYTDVMNISIDKPSRTKNEDTNS